MSQPWFVALGAAVAAFGSRAAWRERPRPGGRHPDRGWRLLLALAWVPLACWVLSQFVIQD